MVEKFIATANYNNVRLHSHIVLFPRCSNYTEKTMETLKERDGKLEQESGGREKRKLP